MTMDNKGDLPEKRILGKEVLTMSYLTLERFPRITIILKGGLPENSILAGKA